MQRTPEKTALQVVFYIPVRVWVLVWRSLANTREGARGGTWLLKLSVPRSIRQFNARNFRPVCPPACWTSSGCSRVIHLGLNVFQTKIRYLPSYPSSQVFCVLISANDKTIHPFTQARNQGVTQDSLLPPTPYIQLPCCLI